jgi:methyl-accepting chemotaxis protein
MKTIRKKYFVKPRTQGKYLIILGVIMALFSLLCYYVFYNALLNTPGMEQLSSGAIKYFKRAYTGGFFWTIFIFASFVLINSVFYFHRILGPLYFFEFVMKRLAGGDFSVKMHWRKKDETKDLAFLIGTMIDNTRAAVLEDRAKIAQAQKAIDEKDYEKAKEILSDATKWFKTAPMDSYNGN